MYRRVVYVAFVGLVGTHDARRTAFVRCLCVFVLAAYKQKVRRKNGFQSYELPVKNVHMCGLTPLVPGATPAGPCSAIYTGYVRHRRFLPIQNAFKYRIFMMYLDLDELPHVFDGAPLWSYERFNLACFQRKFFYGDASLSLADAVRAGTRDAIGRNITGPIRMLTHLRYWGYCYNPVTFYYLFESDGKTLAAITAEITNTPWGERHAYYHDCQKAISSKPGLYRWQFPKAFHVSPFMPMEVDCDWRFGTPGEKLNVHMQNMIDAKKYFDATLILERQPLTPSNLNRVLWHYPVMTTKVVTMIHWQALRLWAKRTPFYEHPKYKQEKQHEDG